MVNQEQYFDLTDTYFKEYLGNRCLEARCLVSLNRLMQIGLSVLQSGFCATPSSGRSAMLCDLCSTCSEVNGMSHLHSWVLDWKIFLLWEEIMKPTCHFQAAFTAICICCTFSSLSLWTARRVILHWMLSCMPVYMYFYTFDFNGVFNGNYF